MTTWPSSLPQDVTLNSFDQEFPNGAVRAETDSGPAFQRQRFTAAPEPFAGTMIIDKTQYNTLLDFWKNTTNMGATPFDWKHPITGNAATVQFDVSSPPSISLLGQDLIEVSLNFEVLP